MKTYFEETDAFKLPRGHPKVAFTEPQVYHLLRVLTEETLRVSYTTMVCLALDDFKGNPTTAPSRTDHFRRLTRATTPFRNVDSDSSDAETVSCQVLNLRTRVLLTIGNLETPLRSGESDSAGEMALTSASFNTTDKGDSAGLVPITAHAEQIQTEN